MSITNPAEDDTGSRQARKDLMLEGWQTFVEHPLTGVGAGQFKNYNPPDRLAAVARDTQCAAADRGRTGRVRAAGLSPDDLAGLLRMLWTRRMFSVGRQAHGPRPRGRDVARDEAFRPDERDVDADARGRMSASLLGWIVCAQFASVGYYWTFYYLFALIVAGRKLTTDRIVAAHKATRPARRPTWQERSSPGHEPVTLTPGRCSPRHAPWTSP